MSAVTCSCGLLIDLPSEVMRGDVIGVCPGCNKLHGPAAPKPKPPIDHRGRPTRPGVGA